MRDKGERSSQSSQNRQSLQVFNSDLLNFFQCNLLLPVVTLNNTSATSSTEKTRVGELRKREQQQLVQQQQQHQQQDEQLVQQQQQHQQVEQPLQQQQQHSQQEFRELQQQQQKRDRQSTKRRGKSLFCLNDKSDGKQRDDDSNGDVESAEDEDDNDADDDINDKCGRINVVDREEALRAVHAVPAVL